MLDRSINRVIVSCSSSVSLVAAAVAAAVVGVVAIETVGAGLNEGRVLIDGEFWLRSVPFWSNPITDEEMVDERPDSTSCLLLSRLRRALPRPLSSSPWTK